MEEDPNKDALDNGNKDAEQLDAFLMRLKSGDPSTYECEAFQQVKLL